MAGPQVWVRREQSCHSSLDFKSVLGRLEITIWSKEFLGRVILTGTVVQGSILIYIEGLDCLECSAGYWNVPNLLLIWCSEIGMCWQHKNNVFWKVHIMSRDNAKSYLLLFFQARLSLRSIPLKWWPGFQTHSVFNQNSHKIFPPSLPSYFLYFDFAFMKW